MRLAERAWPYLAIAAIVALGVATLGDALGPPPRTAGFLVYQSGAVASLARAEWPGFRAGLRVRDAIVSVDGVSVRGGPAVARALERLPDGAIATIEAVSPTGERRAVRLPIAPMSRADLGYTFLLPFSVGLLYLVLGCAIFFVKRDAATTLTLAICLVASAFYLTMFDAHTHWRFTRIWVSYPLLGPLSVHLFSLFPERRPAWTRARLLAPLYALGAAAIAARQLALDEPRAADAAAFASSVMLSAEFVVILGLLLATLRKTTSPATRNRAKTTLIGMAATVTVVVAWQFASRASGPPLITADRAMLFSAAFPLLIAYALLRRNLFDIDAVLRASLIYGLATALVLALYFGAVAILGATLTPLARRFAFVGAERAPVAAVVLVAALFHPLRVFVQRFVDRLLLGPARAVDEELAALASSLPSSGDLATVGDDVVRRLQRMVGARWVALLAPADRGDGALRPVAVAGTDATLAPVELGGPLGRALVESERPIAVRGLAPAGAAAAPAGAELLVALRARAELVGLVAVGPRRVAQYRFAERHALARAASPVALALDHGRLLAERAARERLAALGAMAAVIVHEVKNPLGIIKVSAGTLRKRAADDASAELAGCIEDEVDRMDATCRRLLELGRPPAPSLGRCDLGEIVRATV